MQEKKLICKDCAMTFAFTADEQHFYEARGLKEPVRCADCRKKRRKALGIERHEAVCGACGHKTLLPFEPKQGRPVLCERCFKARREQG